MTRRRLITTLLVQGCVVATAPAVFLAAQDQAPSRRELVVTVRGFRFVPDRLEVVQDDLVRVTIHGDALAHSFNIDEYRIARRVPPGGTAVVEFRADRTGTFPFYCNITSEPGHDQMRGQLVVRPR
jgi:nitrous-oxide reductase